MQNRLKNDALLICLFVFLFVIIGGGLHLASGGAFLHGNGRPITAKNEVHYASNTTNKPD